MSASEVGVQAGEARAGERQRTGWQALGLDAVGLGPLVGHLCRGGLRRHCLHCAARLREWERAVCVCGRGRGV